MRPPSVQMPTGPGCHLRSGQFAKIQRFLQSHLRFDLLGGKNLQNTKLIKDLIPAFIRNSHNSITPKHTAQFKSVTELQKTSSYFYQFITEGITMDADEEVHRVRSPALGTTHLFSLPAALPCPKCYISGII